MIRRIINHAVFGVLTVGIATGCGKADAPGSSVGLQPIAVASEQAGVKEETKAAPLAAGAAFNFPADEGGKILGRILPPGPPAPLGPLPAKAQSERILPGSLAAPDATRLPASLSPRLYPQPPRQALRPSPLPDRIPIDLASRELDRPGTIVLPVGGLTKIDALDVKSPVALPILARPTADRASLEDPTAEFTARSIINDNLPLRVTLAMFVKVNLPDPFENVEAARVKVTIPEDPARALGNPPPRP